MYSIGILLSCFQFLRLLAKEPVSVRWFQEQKSYIYTTPENVLKLLKGSSCIVKNNGFWYLTEKGENFLFDENLFSYEMGPLTRISMKKFLKDSLLTLQPKWIKSVYKGRLESLKKIENPQEKRDIATLLKELELLRETTDEAIAWWEEMVSYFAPNVEIRTDIGNKGEKLSREYEKERVGSYPYWESKFSSISGYDLVSTISNINLEKLYIEVKCSQRSYVFYLTRGEWKKAQRIVNYLFHFWHLEKGELYTFTPYDISHHVSVNQGNGEWTVCEIELSLEEQEKFRVKK